MNRLGATILVFFALTTFPLTAFAYYDGEYCPGDTIEINSSNWGYVEICVNDSIGETIGSMSLPDDYIDIVKISYSATSYSIDKKSVVNVVVIETEKGYEQEEEAGAWGGSYGYSVLQFEPCDVGQATLSIDVRVSVWYLDNEYNERKATKTVTYRFPLIVDSKAIKAFLKDRSSATANYGEPVLLKTLPYATVAIGKKSVKANAKGKASVKIPIKKIGSKFKVRFSTKSGINTTKTVKVKGNAPGIKTNTLYKTTKKLRIKTTEKLHKGDYIIIQTNKGNQRRKILKDGKVKSLVNIGAQPYGTSIKISIYNKFKQKLGSTKKIKVYYSKGIKTGYTKKQVQLAYNYGSPDRELRKGSYVVWVYYWYDDDGEEAGETWLYFSGNKLKYIYDY